jgi:hypothetical protein
MTVLLLAGCNAEHVQAPVYPNDLQERDRIVDVQESPEKASPTNESSELDKWTGFRGFKWGTNIRDMNDPNMVLISDDKGLMVYRRVDDKLSIGEAELSDLHYGCYRDRFCSVMILTEKERNFRYLKDAVFARYGEGYKGNRFIDQWMWTSTLPGGGHKDILMNLAYNKFTEETILSIYYEPVMKELANAHVEKAKEAREDF